jgi:hypothetical protein
VGEVTLFLNDLFGEVGLPIEALFFIGDEGVLIEPLCFIEADFYIKILIYILFI